MSALFLWLRRGKKLPPERLEAAQKLLAYRGGRGSKAINGPWQGVISAWGDASLMEENGRLLYSAQAATGIPAVDDSNRFYLSQLAKREGLWVLIEIDPRTSRVTLARDRFGGLPLFIYEDGDNFILSSEIKPLLAALPGRCPISLSRLAGIVVSLVPTYLGGETVFENIWEVKQGKLQYFDLVADKKESLTYFAYSVRQPLWAPPTRENLNRAAQILRSDLRETIRRQCSLTGRIALALSAGVDSSIIAVELKKIGIPFTSFTVTYPECKGQDPDESPGVRLTAKRLGLHVQWVEVEGDGLLEVADELIVKQEAPLYSPGLVVAWELSRAIKDKGVTTGAYGFSAGGVLGGVPRWWLGALACKSPLKAIAEWRFWHKYIALPPLLAGVLTFLSLQTREWVNAERRRRYSYRWLKIQPVWPTWLDSTERDYANYHITHIREKDLHNIFMWEERRAAYYGLRSVLPFLDLTLRRNMQSVPESFKLHRGWNKYLARFAYTDELPPEVIWNRRKLGFDVPMDIWINRVWHKELKEGVVESRRLGEIVDLAWMKDNFESLPLLLRWRLYTAARFLELFEGNF